MIKKNTLLLALTTGIGWLALTSYSNGPGAGGLGDRSSTGCGSPGAGCHADNNTATQIVSHTLVGTGGGQSNGQYTPGAVYIVTVVASNQGTNTALTHFGFQTTARFANGANAGTLAPVSSTTHAYTAGGLTGIEHDGRIARSSNNFYQASFQWTAPPAGSGAVTFFSAVNLVNNNSAVTGDQPNTGSATFAEGTTDVEDVQNAAPLAIYPNPAKDQVRIPVQTLPAGEYGITVVSSTGSVVLQQRARHNGSTETFDVVLPNLATGLYGLRLQGGGIARSAPLFVR